MTGPTVSAPLAEAEVVGVTVGGALVSGALSLLGPYLASLTGALAAIAFAGWVAERAGAVGRPRPRLGRSGWFALGGLGVGAWVFLVPPPGVATFRALLLAIALVPLWRSAARGGR
jgi:hypothetical protein